MNPPAPHQGQVDSLRGWAALSVLVMHTFRQKLLPEFPLGHYAHYLQADRAAVLLFFVISGYVIGLSTRQPCTAATAARYGWRRAVRILPVYLLAVALAWAVVPATGWRTLLGHLAFLQDSSPDNPLRVDNLAGNTPLWSLHYEALFYVLFLVWWRWPATAGASLAGALLAGVWAAGSTAGPGWLVCHAVGAVYWLSGLLLSRCPARALPAQAAGMIVANLLWLHAVYHFAPVALLQAGLHLPVQTKAYMPLADLVYLPLGVTLVALAGGRKIPWARLWQLAAGGAAAAGLVMVLAAGKSLLDTRWLVSAGYLVAGGVCFFAPIGPGLLTAAARVGAFSYALYALHFPVLMLLGRLFPAQVSLPVGLLAVCTGWAVAFPLAWWLELRAQPRLRAWLDQLAGVASPPPRLAK